MGLPKITHFISGEMSAFGSKANLFYFPAKGQLLANRENGFAASFVINHCCAANHLARPNEMHRFP